MLVTFTTNAYSDITMFGDAAVALLKLMGQSGNVPGAILAHDIPDALKTLRQGLAVLDAAERGAIMAAEGASQQSAASTDDDDNPPVDMHTRAGPLISLLEAAAQAGENVLWDS